MRTITRATLALSGAAALTLFAVVPANAVDAPPSEIVVSVEGGDLAIGTGAITQPSSTSATSAPLATAEASIAGVTITDPRAGVANWAATVTATPFTSTDIVSDAEIVAALTESMAGIGINYAADAFAFTTVSESTASAVAPFVLPSDATSAPVAASAAVSGNNTATWNAELSFEIPAGALEGIYQTVITHSVL